MIKAIPALLFSTLILLPQASNANDLESLMKSVGKLECSNRGRIQTGSGFLFQVRDKTLVATAKHTCPWSLRDKDTEFKFFLFGASEPVFCHYYQSDAKSDLLILSPTEAIKAEPLRLAKGGTDPKLGDDVWLFGTPHGVGFRLQDGCINGMPTKAGEINELLLRVFPGRAPYLYRNTQVLQHNAASTPGYSGGPVVNGSGEVIGIQHGVIPHSDRESVSVDVSALKNLDLSKPLPAPDYVAASPYRPTMEQHSGTVVIGGAEIESTFSVYRHVPQNYDRVVDEYIRNKRYLRMQLTELLNGFVDTTALAVFRNHVFGYSFLAPRGTRVRMSYEEGPIGRLVIRLPDEQPIEVTAFFTDEFEAAAQESTIARLIERGFPPAAKTKSERALVARQHRLSEMYSSTISAYLRKRFGWSQDRVRNRADVSQRVRLADDGSSWANVLVQDDSNQERLVALGQYANVCLILDRKPTPDGFASPAVRLLESSLQFE